MNSEKAARVRDAIKGCPSIVDPENTSEYRGVLEDRRHGGVDVTFTGEFLTPNSAFAPPTVREVGTLGNGDGVERPVHVVVLESVWTDASDVRSLSPQLVYEIAKHDCRIRFYPPEHRHGGSVWICDHHQQPASDTAGDRCPECQSTYFKIRDGEPECARCGTTEENVQTTLTEAEA